MDQKGRVGKSILDRLEGGCGGFCPGECCCTFGGLLQEVMQGLEGLGTARDKTVVEVNQTQEFPQLTLCERQGKSRMACTLSSIGRMPWLST